MVLLSRVLTGAMLMGGISTKPRTHSLGGVWVLVHCWVLEQQTTRYAAGMFCVRVFGVVVSLVCPRTGPFIVSVWSGGWWVWGCCLVTA